MSQILTRSHKQFIWRKP